MKNVWATIFATSLCITSLGAHAGTQTGIVSDVIVRASDGLIWFWVSGTAKTGSPACAQGAAWWMIRDETSVAGKQQYAMLLAAHAAGKTVTVSGMNSCNRWSSGEDVDWIQILSDSQQMLLSVESLPEPL